MSNKNQILNDSDLIEAFVVCAIEREQALLGGTIREATRSAYKMKALDDIFRDRGRAVQSMLLPFLDDPSEGVRYWASMRLWPIFPGKARTVMENIAKDVGYISADARGTIREIDSSEFNPAVLWAPKSQAHFAQEESSISENNIGS